MVKHTLSIWCKIFKVYLTILGPYAFTVGWRVLTFYLWVNVWSYHILCVIFLNDIMDLNLLSLDTLVAAATCCVFYAPSIKFTQGFTWMTVFASTLIWHHTQRQTHSGHKRTNRLTHTYKYISTSPVMCTLQLHVLYWMNKCTSQRSTMSLLLKNYSLENWLD